MSIVTPVRPVKPLKTGRRDNVAFTIHYLPNRVYAVPPSDKRMKISVVSFRNNDHAHLLAGMLEEYHRRTMEWPDIMNDHSGDLILPKTDIYNLRLDNLSVIKWDLDDLKFYCLNNTMDLITLNSMTPSKKGFSVGGDTYIMDAPVEFYQERFDQLYTYLNPF